MIITVNIYGALAKYQTRFSIVLFEFPECLFPNTVCGRYCYFHSSVQKSETQRIKSLHQATQLVRGRAVIYSRWSCSSLLVSHWALRVWREGFPRLVLPSDASGTANSRHLISVRSLRAHSAAVITRQLHRWADWKANPSLEGDASPPASLCSASSGSPPLCPQPSTLQDGWPREKGHT